MPVRGCCGSRFVFRPPPLHALHLPSDSLWKSSPSSLSTLHCAYCLHHARRVGFCHHPALSNSVVCCPLHLELGKSRMGLPLPHLSASSPTNVEGVWKMLPASCLDSAGLFGCFMPAYLSLELHHVGRPLSNLRPCHLSHVFYFSSEVWIRRVWIYCYRRVVSFSPLIFRLLLATPVKFCSIVIWMRIYCLLHQFLGPIDNKWALIQKEVRIPYRMYLVKAREQKKQAVDVRRCLLAISLTTCRLHDICKEVLHYFPDLFFVVCTYLPYL